MEAAQPGRRERRRVELRERILQEAIALFETQGYETTTVTEIAERADIAYGTFFNHFPSKHDLLREVSEQTMGELFRDVARRHELPGTFAEHLVSLFEESAEEAERVGPQKRELLRAMMALAFSEGPRSDDRRVRRAFRAFLEQGRASSAVRDDVDLDTLTDIVVGTWYSMFLSWVNDDAYPLRQRAAAAGRFLAKVCRAGTELGNQETK